MPALRELPHYLEEHPGARVLVVGHTDTDGNAVYNRYLAEERARIVCALLGRDVDAWLAWYRGRESHELWGPLEDNHMLNLVLDESGGYALAKVQRFQRLAGLARTTGVMDAATRAALIGRYLGEAAAVERPVLAHGCGEFHPAVATGDGVGAGANRRVEVFLFDGEVTPAPRPSCPAPGCPEYARWQKQVVETIDLRLWKARTVVLGRPRWQVPGPSPAAQRVSVRVLGRFGRPCAGTDVVVGAGRERFFATTDAEGWAHGDLDAIPARAEIRFEHPGIGGLVRQRLAWGVTDLRDRLAALGHPADRDLAAAVAGFQRDHHLPITGVDDAATRARVDEIFGGGDPARTAVGERWEGSSLTVLEIGEPTCTCDESLAAWVRALADGEPGIGAVTLAGESLEEAIDRCHTRAARGGVSADAVRERLGGLWGHTLLVAFTPAAWRREIDVARLAAALRRTLFEHVYLLPLGEAFDAGAVGPRLHEDTGCTIFANRDGAHLQQTGGRIELRVGEGRPYWGGAPRPLRAAAPRFLAGAQERWP